MMKKVQAECLMDCSCYLLAPKRGVWKSICKGMDRRKGMEENVRNSHGMLKGKKAQGNQLEASNVGKEEQLIHVNLEQKETMWDSKQNMRTGCS